MDKIRWSGSVDLGFMINAADYADARGVEILAESISALRLTDKFRFARIAVDSKSYDKAIALSKVLQPFGFDVFINLMRIASLHEAEIKKYFS